MNTIFNKRLTKIIVILLCCVIAAAAFAGCKSEPGGKIPDTGDVGTHDREPAEDTGGFILKSGATQYKIVLPQSAVSSESMAADEIQSFFFEATGIELPIVTDSGLSYAENAKYISVGRTALLTGAGIAVDGALLGGSGYRVVTEGESIFVFGAAALGTVYGAYDLLHEMLNYEFYYEGCYSLDKNVKEIKLMKYKITEVPDIENRCANYGYMDTDTSFYYNLRGRQFTEPFVNIGGIAVHTSLKYIANPPASVTSDPDYAASAPKWKSSAGTQLCYTARGDAKAYELLQKTCLDALCKGLISYPSRNVVTMTIEDVPGLCNCSACQGNTDYYGAQSANVLLFCNDLNRAARAWFETPEGAPYKRDLKIIFFGYYDMLKAPTKGGIKCDDGVGVFYAPIEFDFTKSIGHNDNKALYDNMNTWATLTNDIYLWFYSTIFPDYMAPYDTFNSMQSYYKAAKAVNAKYLFDQAQTNNRASSGWSTLKGYLNAKLAWNVNADIGKLIQNFFDNYFGEASGEMRAFFNSYRVHSEKIKAEQGFSGVRSVYINAVQEKFFPKGILQNWKNYIDAALAEIAPLKASDPARYQMLYDHITLERLSVLYLWVQLYDYNTSTEQIADFKSTFKADAERIGVSEIREGSPIGGLFTSWGV